MHAIFRTSDIPPHSPSHAPPLSSFPVSEVNATTSIEDQWTLVLPRTVLGPHREHSLQLQNVEGPKFTHVRLTIFPDGGVKRVRIIGKKGDGTGEVPVINAALNIQESKAPIPISFGELPKGRFIPALSLTPEAFAPFGQVIQSYPDPHSIPNPRTTKITPANFGTATKYHKLALLESTYSAALDATAGISVYRCQPVVRGARGEVEVRALERHPYTNQAFLPLGGSDANHYLVVVAKNGEDGGPDLHSMRAFLAHSGQGIVYGTAVWRKSLRLWEMALLNHNATDQPMTVLDGVCIVHILLSNQRILYKLMGFSFFNQVMDLACVETQIGNGDKADCEVIELESGKEGFVQVQILSLHP